MNLKPGGRLAEIASRVPFGARVLDVGCDHGFIPVYLAERGLAERIYASDIRPGPLGAAIRSAEERGVSDKITFFLADGIPAECAGAVDTIIIAGMGGETITGILQRADGALCGGVLFILQPQSKREVLLDYLTSEGFSDIGYTNVIEGRRSYIIITAKKCATEE